MSKNLKHVWVTAGTKGGVGKSWIAVFFATVLTDLGRKPKLIDCDNENATLSRFMDDKKCHKININKEFALDEVIDIIEQSKSSDFIVDLRAGSGEATLNWLKDVPLNVLREEGIIFHLMCCITSDPDSVQTYMNWVKSIEDTMEYVLVFNEMNGNNFAYYDEEAKSFEEMIKFKKIMIPKLSDIYTTILNQAALPLADFVNNKVEINNKAFRGVVPRTRLTRYYKHIAKQIEKVVFYEGK